MNKLMIPTLETDRLKAEVYDTPGGVGVRFEGDLDLRDPTPILEPFLDSLHSSILKNGVSQIEVDFCKLKYLNSAGIKALIKWVMKLPKLSKEQQYSVKFIYSDQITWQETSLKTLTYLVPSLMSAEKRPI